MPYTIDRILKLKRLLLTVRQTHAHIPFEDIVAILETPVPELDNRCLIDMLDNDAEFNEAVAFIATVLNRDVE